MNPDPSGSHARAVTVSVCSVNVSMHTPVYLQSFNETCQKIRGAKVVYTDLSFPHLDMMFCAR